MKSKRDAKCQSLKQIIKPQLYNNNKCIDKDCLSLMSDTQKTGRRKQVNGLVYSKLQMPCGRDKKGWHHVICLGTEGLATEFHTPDGTIQVEFLTKIIPASITNAVTHFLSTHAPTRRFHGESGVMVAAGTRIDTTSSAKMLYVPSKNNNNKNLGATTSLLCDASRDFNELLSHTCCKDVLHKDLKFLKHESNVLMVPSLDGMTCLSVHPSYAISHNLTNSIHCDVNDNSRSFAIFYTSKDKDKDSCTWFLFPRYGIAIQCSDKVVISWDGRNMEHCSCTTKGDVFSFFASSNKGVSRHCNILKAFHKRKYNKVYVGDFIYTRKKLSDMENIQYIDPHAGSHPQK